MKKVIQNLPERYRSGLTLASLFLFSLCMVLLMQVTGGNLPSDIEVGSIARQDIRSDRDYEIVDEEATEKLQDEALASVDETRSKAPPSARREARRPNLFFNEAEIRLEQERILQGVKPVVIRVQAGESIIRNGDRFDRWHVKVIEGIRKTKNRAYMRTRFLGTSLFIGLFLSILFFVVQGNPKKIHMGGKDLLFFGALLLILIALERVFLFVGGAVQGFLPMGGAAPSLVNGLLPVAAGPMMVALVFPATAAFLFAVVSAALSGILVQGNLHDTLLYLSAGILGLHFMRSVRTRGQILEAGLKLALFNVAALLVLDLGHVFSEEAIMTEALLIHVAMAFSGGLMCAIIVLILMPVFESLFNYLTPIKLLEYGSLNHPLLREMIVQAPGTYHHSHMVGTLAEAACEAIGADSLFARVASYFHDIGKMKKTPYFIENQAPGEDRHGSLNPSMSALIIASHVKEGMDLAREHKLPQRIIDIIPQHQGTKLISYFYSKAKEAEDPDMQVINEKDYRYPGPKPQTREAGVILLADTVEAATRALKDRSPARLEEVVRNMINKNFIDGQLDECELTLKDLHTIAKNFVRILVGVYHQRVEYPQDSADKAVSEITGGERHVDKYSQSKPLGEGSLREAKDIAPKNIRRIGA